MSHSSPASQMKIALFFLNLVFYTTLGENRLNTASDGSETKDCPLTCQPGSYCIQNETKWECGACPSGRFTDRWNSWHACKACRPDCYGANEIIITGCKPDSDIECGCVKDYFHENAGTGSSKCLRLSECVVGRGVDKPATNTSDVTCIECVDGTNFSSIISSNETCQPCRDCEKEGYNKTKECTRSSNADCFIPTTSSSSTAEGTTTGDDSNEGEKASSSTTTEGTTPGDDSNEGEKGHSNEGIIVGGTLGTFLVILVILLACIGYCFWRNWKNQNNNPMHILRTNCKNNVFANCFRPPSGNQGLRRRYSNLCLRNGVTLENDVFTWLSTQLGKYFVRICTSLPGSSVENRISDADIAAAQYKYQSIGGLSDVILEVLLTWRNKNEEMKNEEELFNDIYSTLLHDKKRKMRGIAVKLRDKFAH